MSGTRRRTDIPPEFRWCTNCQQPRPANNGSWSIFNGGKNRRWRCDDCSKKYAERAELVRQQRQELMIKANRERAARDREAKQQREKAREAKEIKKLEELSGVDKLNEED